MFSIYCYSTVTLSRETCIISLGNGVQFHLMSTLPCGRYDKCLPYGVTSFKWISLLSHAIWNPHTLCAALCFNYRLITAYLLLRVNLDKIMHARWDFDASSARTRRVSALDKHQNWSASALFCLNSRAQSKYAVVNLIHTRHKQTFLSFIMW